MARWRIPRPRFSLLTLLLGVVFVGACGGLSWRWEPWVYDVTVPRDDSGRLSRTASSPDGRQYVQDQCPPYLENPPVGEAYICDTQTGKLLHTLRGHTDCVSCVSFSPDGTRMVTGSADHTARVWDVETARQTALLQGHRGRVSCAVFSPNGQQILTTSRDGTLRLWDVKNAYECATIKPQTDRLLRGYYSPDGEKILAEGRDGTAPLCDPTAGKALNDLLREWGNGGRIGFFQRELVVSGQHSTLHVYSRRRPEYWWGLAWLPEFWIALLSGGALVLIAVHHMRVTRPPNLEVAADSFPDAIDRLRRTEIQPTVDRGH